jgi:hypothetical protein
MAVGTELRPPGGIAAPTARRGVPPHLPELTVAPLLMTLLPELPQWVAHACGPVHLAAHAIEPLSDERS